MIVAFGFKPNPPEWFKDFDIELESWGGVRTTAEDSEYPFQTTNPKVFSGGDMVRGSSLVVHAVNEGRKAAEGILNWLGV